MVVERRIAQDSLTVPSHHEDFLRKFDVLNILPTCISGELICCILLLLFNILSLTFSENLLEYQENLQYSIAMKTKAVHSTDTQTSSRIKEQQLRPLFAIGPSHTLAHFWGMQGFPLPLDAISRSKSAWKRKSRVHAWSHSLP